MVHDSSACSTISNAGAMGRTTNIAANIIGALLMLSVSHMASGFSVMRAAKCMIPKGPEHITRAAMLQQCLSKNYAQPHETMCYDELGCFPMDKPWTSLLRPFPSPLHPAEINTRLYCYTRESPERHNITLWPEIGLESCPFNRSRKTAFVIHGFASNGNFSWLSDLKDGYLAVRDANVFLVDWGGGAQLLNYLQVASNTRIVGAEVARFLKWLVGSKGLDPGDVHLMGHSLGAQICSYAAQAVRGIERITAMDPAQPGFQWTDKECRLDKDDANYVEVLHTNALPFIPSLGFGYMTPCGDVDIYLNGGLRQPGCQMPTFAEIKSLKDLGKFPVETLNMLIKCSHSRAYEYFTSALRKDCLILCRRVGVTGHLLEAFTLGYLDPLFSKKCDPSSCFPLGLEAPEARGVFIATTSWKYPYCATDPGVISGILHGIEGNTSAPTLVTGVVDAAKKAGGLVQKVTSGVVNTMINKPLMVFT